MSSRNPQPLSMQWNKRRPPTRPPNTPVLRVAVQGSEIVVSASGTDAALGQKQTFHMLIRMSVLRPESDVEI